MKGFLPKLKISEILLCLKPQNRCKKAIYFHLLFKKILNGARPQIEREIRVGAGQSESFASS